MNEKVDLNSVTGDPLNRSLPEGDMLCYWCQSHEHTTLQNDNPAPEFPNNNGDKLLFEQAGGGNKKPKVPLSEFLGNIDPGPEK